MKECVRAQHMAHNPKCAEGKHHNTLSNYLSFDTCKDYTSVSHFYYCTCTKPEQTMHHIFYPCSSLSVANLCGLTFSEKQQVQTFNNSKPKIEQNTKHWQKYYYCFCVCNTEKWLMAL